jgi:hypothetical protein
MFNTWMVRVSESADEGYLQKFIDAAKSTLDTPALLYARYILRVHANLSQSLQSLITKQIDSTAITLRMKSIKVLQEVYSSTRLPLNSPIIGRLGDASASVRDVALDVIGRSMIAYPGLIDSLFPLVCGRVMVIYINYRTRLLKFESMP